MRNKWEGCLQEHVHFFNQNVTLVLKAFSHSAPELLHSTVRRVSLQYRKVLHNSRGLRPIF